MSGYSSNNKYSLLGGLRAAAQSISYELPLALAVLAVVMMSNSLSTVDIVQQQSAYGILSWNVWRQPIGFLIFWIAALAECERLPFDLPEAEEELVCWISNRICRDAFLVCFIWGHTLTWCCLRFLCLSFTSGAGVSLFPLNNSLHGWG